MKRDPFTLRVALDNKGSARGELYLDDGESYAHRDGNIVWREFVAERKSKVLRISSADLAARNPGEAVDGVSLTKFNPSNDFAGSIEDVRVERVIVVGLGNKPTSVKVDGTNAEVDWEYQTGVPSGGKKEGVAGVLTIKDPRVLIVKDWALEIHT